MPSKTFLNLEKEKQDKIIMTSMAEFTKYDYPEVSINQIIINSGIPRGSFYMYFTDKEDLFSYLIEINRQRLNELTKKIIIKNNGDIYNSFLMLYDEMIDDVNRSELEFIFKNYFIFINLKKEKSEIEPFDKLYEYVKDDFDNFVLKEIDLSVAFNFLMHNLFMALADKLRFNDSHFRNIYINRLKMLCYGIYKNDMERN